MKIKPKILILCDYYLPGYKSGGGMRTLVNMVDRFSNEFDFRIVTRDHDGKLDKTQYTDVDINQWNKVENSEVYYLSKNNIRLSTFRKLIREVDADLIYCNSFFATPAIFALKLRKLRLIPKTAIVMAPCGELSVGALQLKPAKKNIFLRLSKMAGLYKDIIWKASSELEKEEIERVKGTGGSIRIAPDLPPKILNKGYLQEQKPPKRKGSARLVFLSRFMRKKNFLWLLKHLHKVSGKLEIDIIGPLEDAEYWEKCLVEIENLPENVSVRSLGPVPYEEVSEKLLEYHYFILPTLSENFGHVFLEALAAGCPLIISDQTPWLDLAKKGIGWDLTLEDPGKWIEVINKCIAADQTEYTKASGTARSFVVEWLSDKTIEQRTLTVLREGLGSAVLAEE